MVNLGKQTPIQRIGKVWVKRDDLFSAAGVSGGKVRTCYYLSQGASGLVTAGSRSSPQVNIVAHVAAELGIPCRVHTPTGELSPEVLMAKDKGAEVVQHRPGYNSVIIARAREDAFVSGWTEIPFGMECKEAVRQTSRQVRKIPANVERIVISVGSGMSLAGLLHGMRKIQVNIPVIGICVGASPVKRLNRYAPRNWQKMVELKESGVSYNSEIDGSIGDIKLDPIYEAKCLPFLEYDDLFWIVGVRKTLEMETKKEIET